eukprot:c15670_g1_i1.p1 GENE.c15670_g1_i1~~c15670_g1_i1.p1  ORF type:complete len:244 (-),score=58.72 c15670_g1_i1:253-984(-)
MFRPISLYTKCSNSFKIINMTTKFPIITHSIRRNTGFSMKVNPQLSIPISYDDAEGQVHSQWWEGLIRPNSSNSLSENDSESFEVIIQSIKRQAQNTTLLEYLGLSKRDSSEFMLYSIHFWMICNHLRCFGVQGKDMIGSLEKQFWEDKDVRDCSFLGHSSLTELHLCEKQLYFFELSKSLDKALRENSEIFFKQTLANKIYYGKNLEYVNKLFSYIMQEMNSLELTDIESLPSKCECWGICG